MRLGGERVAADENDDKVGSTLNADIDVFKSALHTTSRVSSALNNGDEAAVPTTSVLFDDAYEEDQEEFVHEEDGEVRR